MPDIDPDRFTKPREDPRNPRERTVFEPVSVLDKRI